MTGPAPRRVPTQDQARLIAARGAEILRAWADQGLPPPTALEIGPVRLEFSAPPRDTPRGAEGDKWERPFG